MSASSLQQQITIDRRFCGPPQSGNGGYVAGRMAQYVDGCARVRLMSPPRLGVTLQLTREEGEVSLYDDQLLVAKATPFLLEMSVPPSPSLAAAQSFSQRYGGFSDTPFPNCFVCGHQREKGDGLRIFPGLADDGSMVACVWEPASELFNENGQLHTWAVWSALDCPSGWAFLHKGAGPALLGEIAVDVLSSPVCGQPFIIIAWEIEQSGRKHKTGSALFSIQNQLLACAQATWIEFKPVVS